MAALVALALGLVLLIGGATAAGAQDNGDYTARPAPAVAPPPTDPGAPAAAAQPAESVNVRWLAVTGSDLPGLAALGGLLVAAGVGVLVVRRRTAVSNA